MRAVFRVAAALLAAVALSPHPVAAQQPQQDLGALAANWIEIEREAAHVPGVIAALVVDGEIVMADGWGEADVEARVPADENTRFRVGSVSKPVTATAALLAMQAFGVAPDDDLRGLFEDLPIRPSLDVPLTFHELLTQTGGFNESLAGQHVTDRARFLSIRNYLEARLPPRFETPGRVITYNDHHTVLAGYAVEQLSGQAFADFVRTRLFVPLGMNHSTFDQLDIAESAAMPLARSYDAVGHAYARDYIMTAPAAGLATTASDMGRYLAFVLDPEEELLSSGLHDRQTTVQFRNDPRLWGRAYGFAETSRGGRLVLYKDGQANGFGARLLIVPDLRLGAFIAVNRSVLGPMGRPNEASRFLRDFTGAVLSQVIPDTPAPEAPQSLNGVDSRPFAGTYRTTVAARHTWEKLLAMTDTARVAANDDGSINIGSGHYVPVDDGIYQWSEGGPFHIAFERFEDAGPEYLIFGSGSYELVPWYGVEDGAMKVVAVLSAIALVMLFIASVSFARGGLAAWGVLAGMGSLTRIGFFGVLAGTLILMDPQSLFYGMPWGIAIAVALALLSLGADAMSFLVFTRAKKSTGLIALAVIYFASTGIFAWWLAYWNLLGWHM